MTLYLGDCLDVMARLEAGSVDLILTDLPYGTTVCPWDATISFEALWAQYRRLLRGNGAVVLTAAQPFTSVLVCSNLPWFKYTWTWQKTKPQNFFNAKNAPMRITEDVAVFSPGTTANLSNRRMLYNPQGLVAENLVKLNTSCRSDGTVGLRPSRRIGTLRLQEWTNYPRNLIEFASDGAQLHPTQKPVALMEYLIRTYTNPGDVVLDSCMGSGTTGVAAANTGRRFIGIERDPAYFAIASERLAAARPVLDLSPLLRGLERARRIRQLVAA